MARVSKLPHSIASFDGLFKCIDNEVFKLRFSQASDQFDSGVEVEFGDYRLSRTALRVLAPTPFGVFLTGERKVYTLPWTEVSGFKHEKHWVRLQKSGTDWYVGYNAVPNFSMFLALAERALELSQSIVVDLR